jgi:tRNA threonylcarbamoyladenosine biosynthesis protein TsaE
MKEILIKNLDELEDFAVNYVDSLKKKNKTTLVCLSGDLGSGKTTFSQIIARILGVEEVVTSPTFIIQKTYKTKDLVFQSLVHIDVYRFEESKELSVLGFNNLLKQESTLILLEWPEKVAEILPKDINYIYFTFRNDNERLIKYEV